MTCKPEMARPLTLEDIEELESLIDKYGVDGVIRMHDISVEINSVVDTFGFCLKTV